MILDTLSNAALYHHVHPDLARAFEWLEREAPTASEGTHRIGDSLSVNVFSYDTAPELAKKWESHRRNVDLQVVLQGSEVVNWSPTSTLGTRVAYDDTKDMEVMEPPAAPEARFALREGTFAIFFPEDAHQPGVQGETSVFVRKVVFKLAV